LTAVGTADCHVSARRAPRGGLWTGCDCGAAEPPVPRPYIGDDDGECVGPGRPLQRASWPGKAEPVSQAGRVRHARITRSPLATARSSLASWAVTATATVSKPRPAPGISSASSVSEKTMFCREMLRARPPSRRA